MHQQLPHVPLLQTRHPDPRKPIFHQQLQSNSASRRSVFCLRTSLARIFAASPSHNSMPQLRQQPLEPGIVPAGFHPHPHRLARQAAVKLLALPRDALIASPRSLPFVVKDRDLLKPRMKITAYNQHDVGSFSSLGRFATSNLLRDRANVVIQSSEAWTSRSEVHAESKDPYLNCAVSRGRSDQHCRYGPTASDSSL